MANFNKIVLSVHRISGTVIAVFFLMWFFTGLILLYHDFPRLDRGKALELASALPKTNPLPDSLPSGLKALSIGSFQDQTLVEWSTRDDSGIVTSDGEPVKEVTFKTAETEALKWVDAPIAHVDTLHERDQWIMYSRYLDELPIYKFYFDDPAGSQVYVASRSGEVLMYTDRKSRTWAWMGAIPHKLYFPAIRSDVDRWKVWLLVGSSLCLIASLSGLYAGLYVWIKKRRKTGLWVNPFHRKMDRWHFALGLIFAIPLIAWSISGMFAMRKVPQWLVPVEGRETVSFTKLWGRGMLPIEEYRLSYDSIISAYPSARNIVYGKTGDIPVCRVVMPDSTVELDASFASPTKIHISLQAAEKAVGKLFGDSLAISSELMTAYDNNYFSISGRAPLPVYKISVKNKDNALLYINPDDGQISYFNNNRKARSILFGGIHYLNLPVFTGHPIIWKACMWIVCLLGIVFCYTSVWLDVKYIGRLTKSITGNMNN